MGWQTAGWAVESQWLRHARRGPGLAASIMAFTRPGDSDLVQPPVYYPFFNTIRGGGRNVAENPLIFRNGRFEMDFDDLERKLDDSSVKLVFLCSPHNPGGRVWTREELTHFAELCVARGVVVVSDEIHSDIIFKGAKHTPLASISEAIRDRTITTVAPSKTFNIAGLASAVIIPSRRLRTASGGDRLPPIVEGTFGTISLEVAYNREDHGSTAFGVPSGPGLHR